MSNSTYKDHLGNEYKTFEDMASAYGISSNALRVRLKKMTLEKALTTPKKHKGGGSREIQAFGRSFKSITEMAKVFDVPCATLRVRLRRGEAPEIAIKKGKETTRHRDNAISDENGIRYKNLKEAAAAYGIPYIVVRGRTNHGWTREEALLIPQDTRAVLGGGKALFIIENTKYYSYKCPICNNDYIMCNSEKRQHYIYHIKRKQS